MKTTLLILWMLMTVVLTLSVIGLVLFVPKDSYQNAPNTRSTWMSIGTALLESVLND